MSSPLDAIIVIDYQNIHLTAHDTWAPNGTPRHETLVHPLHFANQVLKARAAAIAVAEMSGTNAPARPHAVLKQVVAYRGLPSNKHAPQAYARSQAQKSEWTKDPRVTVNYRPLRYRWSHELGDYEPREKGIDVLVALHVVAAVDEGACPVVILASHDTDLEPALEVASSRAGTASFVETAGWEGCKKLKARGVRLPDTRLGATAFVNSRDRKPYA